MKWACIHFEKKGGILNLKMLTHWSRTDLKFNSSHFLFLAVVCTKESSLNYGPMWANENVFCSFWIVERDYLNIYLWRNLDQSETLWLSEPIWFAIWRELFSKFRWYRQEGQMWEFRLCLVNIKKEELFTVSQLICLPLRFQPCSKCTFSKLFRCSPKWFCLHSLAPASVEIVHVQE